MTRALLLLLLAIPAAAQIDFSGGADSSPKVTIEAALQERSGDAIGGMVTAKIADGWHINSNRPTEDFAIPTVIELQGASEQTFSYPAHAMKAFAFTGGRTLAVYDGRITIPYRAKVSAGATTLRAKLRYQACSDRVCLPPADAYADIDLNRIDAAAPPVTANFTPLSAAPKGAKAKSSLFSSDVGGTFESRGLPLTLVAIFVLGLALNLTPCVYPLIPITVGYFSNQSGERRSRRLALSLLYVLGIAVTYSVLGVFSALSGKLFGAWLQHPGVLVFFAALMLVMASSMFGMFEIRVPQFISSRSGGQAGLAGALTMGLLIGIVAAPCVGPFVISLIALVSSLQSPLLGFLMFFVLALGLGLPYLLLGIFSSGMSALPRSGEWMVQVKKAMGFILMAMAFYFLRPLLGDVAFQYGVAASLLSGALFLFFSRSRGARAWRIAISILLLVSGVAFALPKKHAAGVQWLKYDTKVLAAARAAGKPVVIDFYADWCLPCKELDHKTFTDAAVIAEMDRFVRLKADLTADEDPMTKKLEKEYAIIGVPTILFLDATGREVHGARLVGFEPPVQFLARVRQVR